jgi:3-oxoacyl-[acyl-carrier-protein] synthase II
MRADVSTLVEHTEQHAHGLQSVGIALEARHAAADHVAARVAITSWAARTAFGDLSETWRRLLQGDSIDDHMRLADRGETDRALALARAVASNLTAKSDAAVIVGTSKGSIEEWFNPPPVSSTSDKPPSGLRSPGLADIAATLAADLGTRGPLLTLSAACASGLHALIRAAMMIRSGEVRQAVVVGTEASVHPLFLGSFQRLGVLAKPGDGCRPFDRNRSGFYMSEAACAVLLEAANPDGPGSASICVENFALGGDATHLTGGDPDGRVLRHLMNKVVDRRPVDLIHAHGTGTVLNDETELAAIEAAVGEWAPEQRPIVYSHKAALGHSLGASGLLSVVLNCQAHAAGAVPPNVRTTDPLPTRNVTIGRTITRRQIARSLAMAAGFGGPTAVLSLTSSPKPESAENP